MGRAYPQLVDQQPRSINVSFFTLKNVYFFLALLKNAIFLDLLTALALL